MALEAGDGFISGLVVTNPVNATDQVAQGDDHIRLIKTALKGTFPNLTGAMTATQAELNILDGATLSTAELNILDGVTLTASQINDAARQSNGNIFTAAQFISTTAAKLVLIDSGGGSDEKRVEIQAADVAGKAFRIFSATDAGVAGSELMSAQRSGTTWTNLDFAATTIGFAGNVSTPGLSASEVGYNGTPQNAQNGDYTLVLTDRGKTIYKASGGAGETITIPANGSVAFPVGTIARIVNNGGGDLTIAITTDTLSLAGAGTTGSRTLGDHGVAVIEKVASTEWFISGIGLS